MNTRTVLKFLLLILLFPCQIIRAGEQKLPVLTGTVTYAAGSFFGYGKLHAGDTMKLDLGAIGSVTNMITFKRGKSSGIDYTAYIPLPSPLRIDKIERDAKGKLHLARLISGSQNSDGTDRVLMDIECYGTQGGMWIIQEQGIVQSIARLECQFSK
ncbi:MAG TPA: hypothetical protein VKS19_01305 [Verrucomicrobiae bacterium]|nr:hypothetical protein [Verrucomicrobiae bacterium]